MGTISNLFEKVLLVSLFVTIIHASRSQATSIVYDPTNAAQIGSVLSSIDEIKQLQETWKANTEFLNKVVEQGAEVKRLVSLLESLVCATDDFKIYINVVGDLTLCERKLNIDLTMGKLDAVNGNMKSILTGAYALTQFETIESLKDLNDQLEEAIAEINSLNTDLRLDVQSTLNAIGSRRNGAEEVSWNTEMGI